ncbi:pectinesterase family protein [Streptomyces apocyni]|uniref:pectinesterase family protein n=1 Tax=Streptomyces apocyni TaxID=2654677 RepID=UPI0012EA0910|nr:pectinesterase family protein [Streptomyces apocyni]
MTDAQLSRRSLLLAGSGATLAAGLGLGLANSAQAQAQADADASSHRTPPRPFGRYGSPAARRSPLTRYVHPGGRGDFRTVQAAVDAVNAVNGTGYTLVIAPGTYRETVSIGTAQQDLTLIGASENPRDTVIVYDNAAGTPRPDGSGRTYGTTGSATATIRPDGFTARWITFANDWLRADHPEITGTQAVALKVMGDRSAFHHCRFLGHQDTLYADTRGAALVARQYFAHCYVEGDVDFVFGRATAVFEHCRLHTLDRDVGFTPKGMVFAPSTARATPYGFLAVRCRVTSGAPDGAYKLARPWAPSSDASAWPSLVVRDSLLGAGIDATAPYTNMRDAYPWQEQRFAEYANKGPGAHILVPDNRPQLSYAGAREHTRRRYLGDWQPR